MNNCVLQLPPDISIGYVVMFFMSRVVNWSLLLSFMLKPTLKLTSQGWWRRLKKRFKIPLRVHYKMVTIFSSLALSFKQCFSYLRGGEERIEGGVAKNIWELKPLGPKDVRWGKSRQTYLHWIYIFVVYWTNHFFKVSLEWNFDSIIFFSGLKH